MKNQPYTKEFIHEAIIQYHRNVFGYTQAPDTKEEIRDAYFILGFTMSALDYLEKRVDQPEKVDGSEPEEDDDIKPSEDHKYTNKIRVEDMAGNSATVECTFNNDEVEEEEDFIGRLKMDVQDQYGCPAGNLGVTIEKDWEYIIKWDGEDITLRQITTDHLDFFSEGEMEAYREAIQKGIENQKRKMEQVYDLRSVARAVEAYTGNPVSYDKQKSQGSFAWFKVEGKKDFGTTYNEGFSDPYEIAIKLQKYVSSDEGTLKDPKELLDERIRDLAMKWFAVMDDTSAVLRVSSSLFREHFSRIEDREIETQYGKLTVKEDNLSRDEMYIEEKS